MEEKRFSPEEVDQGLHLDLLRYLINYNSKTREWVYDIHITYDGYDTIIQWCDRSESRYPAWELVEDYKCLK